MYQDKTKKVKKFKEEIKISVEEYKKIIRNFSSLAATLKHISTPDDLQEEWKLLLEYLINCGDSCKVGDDLKCDIMDIIFQGGKEFFDNFAKHKGWLSKYYWEVEYDYIARGISKTRELDELQQMCEFSSTVDRIDEQVELLEHARIYFGSSFVDFDFDIANVFDIATVLDTISLKLEDLSECLVDCDLEMPNEELFTDTDFENELLVPFEKIFTKELVTSFFDAIRELREFDFERRYQDFIAKLNKYQKFIDYDPIPFSVLRLKYDRLVFLSEKWVG